MGFLFYMRFFSLVFCFTLCLVINSSSAQNIEYTGWISSVNTLRLSEKWGIHFDGLLRSSDEFRYTRNLLLRPGLTYFLDKRQSFTLGYVWSETFDDPASSLDWNLTEHRAWQQYHVSLKFRNTALTTRVRLEQRFMERLSGDIYMQRLRHSLRLLSPLKSTATPFTHGSFLNIQNELFLNVQNKDKLNNKTVDQFRVYLALGLRFNKGTDIEAGYLHQHIYGLRARTVNHIIQLSLNNRF